MVGSSTVGSHSVAVSSNSNSSGSILGALADHEAELLQKLESARAQAREIVEEARGEARRILQKAEADLIDEVAGIRRAAQEARDRSFRETVETAEEKLRGAMDEALKRVPDVANEVVQLFMPKTGGGTLS